MLLYKLKRSEKVSCIFLTTAHKVKMMNKLPRKMKLAAIAAVFSASCFALPAHADVLATAVIDLTNFKFTNPDKSDITNGKEITIISGNNNGTLISDLFSMPGTKSQTQQSIIMNPNPQPLTYGGPGGQFDGTPQIETYGATPRSNNDFAPAAVPVIVSSSYSYADNLISGASVAGVPAPIGVHAGTIAEVAINTNDGGNASSTTGTNTTFDFTAAEDLTVTVSFNYIAQALSYVSADAAPFSGADAGISLILALYTQDPLSGLYNVLEKEIKPVDLQASTSLTEATAGTNQFIKGSTGSPLFFTDTFNLKANTRYQFAISQQVRANAYNTTAIPEPGTLALLGLGLLGLIASPVVRRRS